MTSSPQRRSQAGFTLVEVLIALSLLAVLMLLLGLAGAAHRIRLLPRLDEGRISAFRAIWQVIAAELILMAAVMGVATTLSGTAPPVSEELSPGASPARIIRAASVTATSPDRHTLFKLMAGTVMGSPAATAACLAGFCPPPACTTLPM